MTDTPQVHDAQTPPLLAKGGASTSPTGAGLAPLDGSLLDRMTGGDLSVVLSFAGQGGAWLDELAELRGRGRTATRWIDEAESRLTALRARPLVEATTSHRVSTTLNLWLDAVDAEDRDAMPPAEVLRSSPLSQAMIFLTQALRYQLCWEEGLRDVFVAGAVSAVTGHSQGLMTANLVATSPGGQLELDRVMRFMEYMFLQGVTMELSWRASGARTPEGTAPMASIGGVRRDRLEPMLERFNAALPEDARVSIGLYNTINRHVVTGMPEVLERMRVLLEQQGDREAKKKKEGKFGGSPLSVTWEYLNVDGPYHSRYMRRGFDMMESWLGELGVDLGLDGAEISTPIVWVSTGELYDASASDEGMMRRAMRTQYLESVRWAQTMHTVAADLKADWLVDFGPSDGVWRLSRSNLRGSATGAIALSTADGRRALFTPGGMPARPRPWSVFAPKVVQLADGRKVVDNAFTRATGRSPMILPGMTPTTVEVPIVAAAANAGYVGELAGGGQVSEQIFWRRVDELTGALEPGVEVVFNTLFLDRYLWDLHMGRHQLVVKARRAGAPICGVTISAGIPDVDEAVALLDQLAADGIWLNAFKPGTLAQVGSVLKIAKAAPQHTIFLHLEGGLAGGHHSWEALEELLLGTYAKVREHDNVILCVGGGIGTPERADEMLRGTWASDYGQFEMPVDAILLGTVTMAVKEAMTSSSVKQALVDAAGFEGWVYAGDAKGDVTSGKSGLNADIHYLDNPAARCGRLLDGVAGDAGAIAAKRDEIIAALDATAKPYFGDVTSMTYADVIRRMNDLMAVGDPASPYEDGRYKDVTWRGRVLDALRRFEARLTELEEGTFASIFAGPEALDDPDAALARFVEAYPSAATVRTSPLDADWFVQSCCARPGKPVPFVPVIDEDVRRWYKSDSLWQAHDERFTADQVLAIPGPQAVAGITMVDEPVADLLARFERASVEQLSALNGKGAPRTILGRRQPKAADVKVLERALNEATYSPESFGSADLWLDAIASRYTGAIAAFMAEPNVVEGERFVTNPLRRLCVPEQGASITVTAQQGQPITRLRFRTATSVQDVVVEAREHDTHQDVVVSLGAPGASGRTATFSVSYHTHSDDGLVRFVADAGSYTREVRRFYFDALFGEQREYVQLFETSARQVTFDANGAYAYSAITADAVGSAPPLSYAFSMAWEAIFAVLSVDEVAEGLLRLVHQDNLITPGPAWPPAKGDVLDVTSRAVEVEDGASGRRLRTTSVVRRGGELVVELGATFFIRGDYSTTAIARRIEDHLTDDILVSDAAELALLTGMDGIEVIDGAEISIGDELVMDAEITSHTTRAGHTTSSAVGEVRRGGEVVAHVRIDGLAHEGAHPVQALTSMLAPPALERSTPTKTLARTTDLAPEEMTAFARAGRDYNPIHRGQLIARLAGLDDVIVHGMWTSARAEAFLIEEVLGGERHRLLAFEAMFMAPLACGESVEFIAERVGRRRGNLLVEVKAMAGGQMILRAKARVQAPVTAYVFPGQGIQQRGMGMEGYQRSKAARAVWDRADAYTKEDLGFSILRIVRENPTRLIVHGTMHLHPQGVLHLTQFTQVAMAVLASAQVAEMREAGTYVEDAICCGHSVGEYTALGAMSGVLPLEALVALVYQRGQTMHTLVKREADGSSNYRMGVIRPHYAGLKHEGMEELVRELRESSGEFLEIVNYNVKGRQYSVTGTLAALELLQRELGKRMRPGAKPAYIEVPGIDVPFHSRVLADGVAAFRDKLDRTLPPDFSWKPLMGRYIPNLVPRAFSLERGYVEAVYDYTKSEVLADILANWDERKQDKLTLTRTFLIELLAWQFASPVRWIETQDLLFAPKVLGGMGAHHVVEIGVGYQPTLANMAKYTLSLPGIVAGDVEVRNIEADFELVMSLDEDPEVAAPAPVEDDAPAERAAPAEAAPAAAVAAPAPVAAAGAPAMDDAPMTAGEGLMALLALQGKVRVEQIHMDETIDDVFDGVSSRRNQVLMDLGAEFNMGSIDAAHEMPLSKLVSELERRAPNYSGAGKILKAAQDAALQRVFARAGVRRADVVGMLESAWGMPSKRADAARVTLALEARDGASGRGGALGKMAESQAGSRQDAAKVADELAALYGQQFGVAVAKRGGGQAGGGGVVDAAQVNALRDEILGEEGVMMGVARAVLGNLGHTLVQDQEPDDAPSAHEAKANAFGAELDDEWADWTSPRFKEGFHVEFAEPWAPARRDLTKLYAQAMRADGDVAVRFADVVHHLAAFTSDVVFTRTAGWYEGLAAKAGRDDVAGLFRAILTGPVHPSPVVPARPSLGEDAKGQLVYAEAADPRGTTLAHYVESMDDSERPVHVFTQGSAEDAAWRSVILKGSTTPLPLAGETAVVTGASPGSIAVESVKHLLRGGATVVVTTTSYHARRMAFYKRLYREYGVPGSTLHVVPLNQGSIQDIDAFAGWLFSEVTEQVGAKSLVIKRPMAPTLLLPFGAVRDLGTLKDMGAYSEFALRAMLTGVERLIAQIATHYDAMGRPANPCHVILPLSPNHGVFGGDGAYAESKAGLEVLLNRWSSERHAWGRAITLCGARIGWVRGTGLMDANNPIAAKLEGRTSVRTFSAPEMGFMIAALCAPEMKQLAHTAPTFADLTGGFGDDPAVNDALGTIRGELEEHARTTRATRALEQSWREAVFGDDPVAPILKAMPTQPISVPDAVAPVEWAELPKTKEMLERTVVLVAGAEIGPWGSSRTRHVWEVDAELSAAAVLELAWITGLVRWERGGWVDAESGEEIEEGDIAERYREQLTEHSGIRFIEPEAASYDPQNMPVLTEVFLDQDMTFTVVTDEDARAFKAADPEHTTVVPDGQGGFKVTRRAGSIVRVPRTYRLDRQVAGLVPSGFDPALLGLPADLKENVDRITAYNLVATADAFISAGMTPDELLAKVHPARVANTQGSGIGGMQSLRRLYFDPLLGNERQPDMLQETLINVVAAYVVQSYIGSYGAMVHPVGACATAAVSLEEAYDKILMDRADVVIAGAYDDIGAEGAMGFHDMNATASSDAMEAMGLEPRQYSRPNDVRRRGFVESQGGGTFVVARASVALELGLPVEAVLGWAGSFGDGIHKSIPAPGVGAVAAATGGADSHLGRALTRFGLTADDIGVVYKHDTSTRANDPNENELHHRIQTALGRTPGNPLYAISQKSITGHPKGGAAAFQTAGLCQVMRRGVIPGNHNLDTVDPEMRAFEHIGFTDESIRLPGPVRAGLITSLGFGHVGALVLLIHPGAFEAMLDDEQLSSWREASAARRQRAATLWGEVLTGRRQAYVKQTERRFNAPDGTDEQSEEEVAMLLDPNARLIDGVYVVGGDAP